jgi:hypothetical protein
MFDNYWIYNPQNKEIARQLVEDVRKIDEQ